MSGPEFYSPSTPPATGDPAVDPPMVVRVHPDDDPHDPHARRVIQTSLNGWIIVTGPWCDVGDEYRADEVNGWPVSHPITWGAVFRHALHAEQAPAVALDGGDAEGAAPFKDAR